MLESARITFFIYGSKLGLKALCVEGARNQNDDTPILPTAALPSLSPILLTAKKFGAGKLSL